MKQQAAASPTLIQSRLTSQRSSSGVDLREVSGSALASQVAYGQAFPRKQSEFEKVVSGLPPTLNEHNQPMILLERQGSDCLGAAEIDEQSHGMVKLPFLNKSNQMLLSSHQQTTSGSFARKQLKFGTSLKNDDEDRENHNAIISDAAALGQYNAPLSARTPR